MSTNILDYLKVSTAYQAQSIPKQHTFTFISNQTGIPQAWLWRENNKPELFGQYNDRVLSVHHAPQGNKTVVGVDDNGNEKQQFYLQEGIDGNPETLVYNPEHFHHFGGWSPDGEKISFSSNPRSPGSFDIFIQDMDTKVTKQVFQFDGTCQPLCWLADGEHIIISIDETNIENQFYLLNVASGEIELVGQTGVKATYTMPQPDKAGNGCYLLTNLGGETLYLGWFALDQPETIQPIFYIADWDLEEMHLSPDETSIAFTVNEGGYSRLGILHPAGNQVDYIQKVPAGVIESLEWTRDDQFMFTLKTATMPGDIWSYTISGDTLTRLTDSSRQTEIEDQWMEPTLCQFSSFDGTTIPYFLYNKDQNTEKPAVIYVHGGPESQFRPTYNPVIQYLAHQGFAVAAPNVRGSKGYGRNYIKMDDGRKRMDAVRDLVWLVQDLKQSYHVTGKVGIMGRSYGGFMVLAALTHFPDVWGAGVDIVGISHFTSFLENTGAWRRRLRESEYGLLEQDRDFFDDIAPLYRTHAIQAPLLVFHGRNDTRVPVSEAEQLVGDMRARGQTVDFTVFENEGHQTEKLKNVITMHSETIEFFEKYL